VLDQVCASNLIETAHPLPDAAAIVAGEQSRRTPDGGIDLLDSINDLLDSINYSFCGAYGGRCRIRTCDFHRVKVALYR
jgi:hypothetical protein